MEGQDIGNQCKLIYGDNNKVGALLFYNPNKNGVPFSNISYWEYDKNFTKRNIDFDSRIYGEDKIKRYWETILDLDKDKKLTMNTLCDTVKTFFITEQTLEALRDENRPKDTWIYYPKHMLKYAITKSFKKRKN
jgi:hypothetical protein